MHVQSSCFAHKTNCFFDVVVVVLRSLILREQCVSQSVTAHPALSVTLLKASYRVFSHDVTAAILVSQNIETAAMLVFQINPLGVELFSYANAFFCSNRFA